jgi:beta-N-acetylhexosaminidase
VQLSNNLPYDVACYLGADAQVLAYMSSGTGVDPTDREGGSDAPAFNANFVAAVEAIFGVFDLTGATPVVIPVFETTEDGEANHTDEILIDRGFGLTRRCG